MSMRVGPYHVSPEFFAKRKLKRRCNDDMCDGACCTEGVYLTLYDAQRIVAHGAELQAYLEDPYDFAQWDFSRPSFITTPVHSPNTPNEHCWFLLRNRHCAIHTYALDRNLPIKDIKPYFCRLFPLTLVDLDVNLTEIALDPKAYDTCLVASEREHWLYEQFETELRQFIGEECYNELVTLARKGQ